MGKCEVFMLKKRQTDGRTDRRTTVKQYAPDLSIQGHKNITAKRGDIQMKKSLLCKCHHFLNCSSGITTTSCQICANIKVN